MTPENHSIVPLKEKDAAMLAKLEAECFSTAWSEERYRALLQATDRALDKARLSSGGLPPFLALGLWENAGPGAGPEQEPRPGAEPGAEQAQEANKTLAGYITLGLHEAAQEAEVYNIAIAPSHRRRGLGRLLLARALAFLAKANFCRVVLEVRTGNTPALALYEAAGFVRCGLRKRYYADTGEDALVLESLLRMPS